MMSAGYGFAGTGLPEPSMTVMPADHMMPAMMSESRPPHLPRARTGSRYGFHVIPAMPTLLLVSAPRTPMTRVPCQELLSTLQLALGNTLVLARSVLSIQSPGSDGSGSQPSPSLAIKNVPRGVLLVESKSCPTKS